MLTVSGILIQLVGEMRRRWALAVLSSQSIKAENLFWRLKSRPARPRIPAQIQALIRRIANENPLWREERFAIACDFFVAVTATFRQLYLFGEIEQRSRRPAPSSFQVPIRAIAAINCLPSQPDRSLAACPPSAADPRRAPPSSEP